jgi:predicted Kef-type K+ transport protein
MCGDHVPDHVGHLQPQGSRVSTQGVHATPFEEGSSAQQRWGQLGQDLGQDVLLLLGLGLTQKTLTCCAIRMMAMSSRFVNALKDSSMWRTVVSAHAGRQAGRHW